MPERFNSYSALLDVFHAFVRLLCVNCTTIKIYCFLFLYLMVLFLHSLRHDTLLLHWSYSCSLLSVTPMLHIRSSLRYPLYRNDRAQTNRSQRQLRKLVTRLLSETFGLFVHILIQQNTSKESFLSTPGLLGTTHSER